MFLFKKKNIVEDKKTYEIKIIIEENFEDARVIINKELEDIIGLYPEKEFGVRTHKTVIRLQSMKGLKA